MRTSPLQIDNYFISELHFAANAAFDAKKPVDVRDDQFVVESNSHKDEKRPDFWQTIVRIKHQPAATENAPYSLILEVVGFFQVMSSFPTEKVERLVKTNGSTMLYSIAREIVRSITCSGPYRGLLLPSVSFFEPLPEPSATPTPTDAIIPTETTR